MTGLVSTCEARIADRAQKRAAQNAMGVVMGNLGALIQLGERWARISGRVGRIAELQEVCRTHISKHDLCL